ncbi:MAG TPA: hypothetical protein VKU41_15175 [Polyangiaceae bacterium]|nr:hypothetical protein [Polyangiaceae bacterium]
MTGAGSALDSSVTLDEVFAVIASKRVPLAPELAGYLVLEIAEHADPSGGDVDPKSVFIGEEGTVALVKPRREGAAGDAEASVRGMLVRLLEASGSITPALAAASKRTSGSGLPALAEELETALIPVNRAAGRRALARLAREVRRVLLGVGRNALPSASDAPVPARRSPGANQPPRLEPPGPSQPNPQPFSRDEDPTTTRREIPDALLKRATPADWSELPTSQFEPSSRTPSPSQADVDSLIDRFAVSSTGEQQHARELKAMAGLEPTPPPPEARRAPRVEAPGVESGLDAEVESLLGMARATEERQRAAPMSPPPLQPARAPFPSRGFDERQLPTQPSQLHRSRASFASAPRLQTRRTPLVLLGLGALIVTGGAVGAWRMRSPAAPLAEPAAAPTDGVAARSAAQACAATLVVADVPSRAEILLREGQAPVDVEKMPVGTRLEFVATAEGYAPRRVIVPAGASWDTGSDGKPRLEVAVQLDKSSARAGGNDPWPAGEPGSEVGGAGPPGTVRVIATPRGAEVWLLTGMGPEARIDRLRCDQDLDVLVAGPTTLRKRLHVAAADFGATEPSGGASKTVTRLAKVSAK